MVPKAGAVRALLVSLFMVGGLVGQAVASAPAAQAAASAAASVATTPPGNPDGRPGYAMALPTAGSRAPRAPAKSAASPINASYTHTPPPTPGSDLPPGNGPVMTSQTINLVFWLPTGQHFEADAAGDTRYENLLQQWVKDVGGTQYHNLVTQYYGTNGTMTNSVSFGGAWTDTATKYPHAGTTADPLTGDDVTTEVAHAVQVNGWTEDSTHIVAVFTANGIQQCSHLGEKSGCTFKQPKVPGAYCAYHDHFADSANDAIYAYMSFDDMNHGTGTCDAGDTSNDTDPNRSVYPSGDKQADVEVNTLSHEIIEAATDPHPNATWTNPDPNVGEIGDACNFNFTPRNSTGADVYLNGHGYILQQEYSNLVHTCAPDRCGNRICAPAVHFQKAVDNATPVPGQTITYTVTLNNTDDTGAATNLDLTDVVPAGYTVTGLSAPGATSSATSPVDVKYDTLPVHQAQTVTIMATVPAQAGAAATNCAGLALQDLLGATLAPLTTSPCATTTPQKNDTSTTLSASPTTSVVGQPVTFTATVSVNPPGAGTPTGTVDFFDGATKIGTATLDGMNPDVATLTISSLAVGTHSITATYNGNPNDNPSTSNPALVFIVTRAPTSTVVSSSANPSVFGQPVTFTATVTDVSGFPPPANPSGMVTFYQGATVIGSAPLDGANPDRAVLPAITDFSVGDHVIHATYSGDGNFLPSTSADFTQTVNKAPTTTTVTGVPNPSDFGSSVTFTTHVAPAPPSTNPPVLPTGTVTFSVDGFPIATRPLDQASGTASFTASSLLPGAHVIRADYSGDGNFLASSGTFTQTVTCMHNITGRVPGALILGAGSTCIVDANVGGAVLATTQGSGLFISNSIIGGAVISTGAAIVGICSSQVGGGITIRNTTGFVVVGDPGDDGCGANTVLRGSVQLANNHGDVEVIANRLPSLVVTGTSGTGPFPDDISAEIESNQVAGSLICLANTPAPTNDGRPNTVGGARIGQCTSV